MIEVEDQKTGFAFRRAICPLQRGEFAHCERARSETNGTQKRRKKSLDAGMPALIHASQIIILIKKYSTLMETGREQECHRERAIPIPKTHNSVFLDAKMF